MIESPTSILSTAPVAPESPVTAGKKVLIETWGCQMNTADAERMLALLTARNYTMTDAADGADLVLLNTCHIREKARHKVVSRLGELRVLKAKNPGMRIAVAGCVAQAEGARLLAEVPEIDVLFGPGKIEELPRLLAERAATGKSAMAVGFTRHEHERENGDRAHSHDGEPTVASAEIPATAPATLSGNAEISRFVNIQQGCNNYCTFCVVPMTRGREVSRTSAEIVAETRAMVAAGAREITLLGQNVNSYGLDLQGIDSDGSKPGAFADLLRAVAPLENLLRLRFTTSNPQNFTRELAELFRTEQKLGRYIHLPVQSGSDSMLLRMKRKVTVAEYLERISWLKTAMPDIALSTDLIVGFPGETEEEFEDTLKLVEQVRFSFAFNFKYSPRKNTPANRYQDQVPEIVKEERLARLNALQEKITIELNEAEIGQQRSILFLYQNRRFPHQYYGRTEHFRLVRVDCGKDVIGQCLPVAITGATKTSLSGVLADYDA